MKLHEAAQDQELMKQLQDYFVANLKEIAVERVFNREDTSAIADAAEAIHKSFESISLQFSPKTEPKEWINPAR